MAKPGNAQNQKAPIGTTAVPLWPAGRLDAWLLAAALLLTGFGLVMVYSSTVALGEVKYNDPEFFLKRQMTHVAMGLGLLIGGLLLPYRYWRKSAMPLLGISLVLLLTLHLVPGLSSTINRSTRWLNLGPLSFQPSEVAKFAFVVYLARSIASKTEQMRRFTIGFLPHLLVLLLLIALALMQPDLGTCIILALIMVILMFVAGTRLSYILATVFTGAPALLYAILGSTTRWRRIVGFFDPWTHRYDEGFQPLNALMALASGGVSGLGLGRGPQKLGGFLPQSESDFILPVIGEELGLVGVTLVLGLLAFIVIRGTRIAKQAPDEFGRYLAYGLTLLIGLHTAINAGVAVGLLPTKGLTLPLVSLGGSSLLVCAAAIGVLLNISRFGPAVSKRMLEAAAGPAAPDSAQPPSPSVTVPASTQTGTLTITAKRRTGHRKRWFSRLPGLRAWLGHRSPT